MLKSTHKPTAAQLAESAALPEGWTEHKAPTGHSYYYHAATEKSTYVKPLATPPPPLPVIQPVALSSAPIADPSTSFLQYQAVPDNYHPSRGNFQAGRQGRGNHEQQRPRGPQPTDKPKSRYSIPGHPQWVLVHTKLGRRFVYNADKGQSYWRIPDKLRPAILELDQQRIKEKAELVAAVKQEAENATPGAAGRPDSAPRFPEFQGDGAVEGENSSEYEEVEVSDDDGDNNDPEHVSKRPQIVEITGEELAEDVPAQDDGALEFHEEDIAFQLAQMGQDYDLDPSEYYNDNDDQEEPPLSMEDATALFCDLLTDTRTNPFSPWEKILSDGIIINDPRYTCLPTTKKRKEVWETWSKDKIRERRAARETQEKEDPRVSFLALLQQKGTMKLYWPEFKRKFRKEVASTSKELTEKEREKMYRDYIARLKLPVTQLKAEFLSMLKAQPLSTLNNTTQAGVEGDDHSSTLPREILSDLRYISLSPQTRGELLAGYISTLDGPPAAEDQEASGASREEIQAREKRERALRDRQERVEEMKRRQEKQLAFGKRELREEEAEIERAILDAGNKKGLRGHLMADT